MKRVRHAGPPPRPTDRGLSERHHHIASRTHVIYGGCDWEFYGWLKEGATVEAGSCLTDVKEKFGSFCGLMVLQTGETAVATTPLFPPSVPPFAGRR